MSRKVEIKLWADDCQISPEMQYLMRTHFTDAHAGEDAHELVGDLINSIAAYYSGQTRSTKRICRWRYYTLLQEVKTYDCHPQLRYWLAKYAMLMAEDLKVIGHA